MAPMPFYVAGRAVLSDDVREICSPYDDSLVGTYTVPSAADIERAVAAASQQARLRASAEVRGRLDPPRRSQPPARPPRSDKRHGSTPHPPDSRGSCSCAAAGGTSAHTSGAG